MKTTSYWLVSDSKNNSNLPRLRARSFFRKNRPVVKVLQVFLEIEKSTKELVSSQNIKAGGYNKIQTW